MLIGREFNHGQFCSGYSPLYSILMQAFLFVMILLARIIL